ncbi:FIG00957018: hypothetical protein [plant metagenome]|uniref:DUF2149 domain-containing protein n=2 Tax=root TaxID=1 RepID=A0A1C3JXI6_9BURK|nr:DUF2149 domain-containing protein [Orrella dioscoreae]SBT23999.1 FIG00957018: hypothetical protein [Orrella dioscoreae]SOE51687.1 FIG00957018: hypothetical protein [Orrella dioscoreae]
MRFLSEDDANDPMLSVVNLIDLFLVIIGMLMVVIAQNPLNPFSQDKVVVVENPGESDMRITIKDGQALTRYEASGEMGEGQGARAGVTYRLEDGRMIYVPED